MFRRLLKPDTVALTGCVVGILSLFPGWLNLKPNRIASGANLSLAGSFGAGAVVLFSLLWLVCLALSYRVNRRILIARGLILDLIVVLTLLFSGLAATRLVGGALDASRVSPGAGVWTALLGAYIAIFASRQKLAGFFFWQSLVSYSGMAGAVFLLVSGWMNNVSIVVEFHRQQTVFVQQMNTHIIIFSASVIIGSLIGIPLGVWARGSRFAEKPVFFFTNISQTVPSLALFGLLIAPLSALSFAFPVLRQWGISGIGTAPAVIALVIYSLLPVARNTYVGLKQLDPAVIDAGIGMGMSRGQVFRKIEVPLSAPLVLEGVRTASVQAVGNTAVAALIGAGGLGWFIFQGISQAAGDVVLLGAIPIMVLALLVDVIMRFVVKIATHRGTVAA
jgi:osmoprotectant transport system permease protein